MAVDPNIKKKADDIRNKIYGKEVRESLASGLEEMSTDVTETISRQMQLGSQWQNVVDETTDLDVVSAPEIIAARNGESNLKARLDKENHEVTAQLAHVIKGPKEHKASFALIDDDSFSQVMTKLKPLLDERGFKGSVAVITNLLENPARLSATQLQQLNSEGWSILSHTHNHTKLTDLNEADIKHQMRTSQNILKDLGINARGIVYPNNSVNQTVANITRDFFDVGVGYYSNRENLGTISERVNPTPLTTYEINRIGVGAYSDNATWEQIKKAIDDTIEHKRIGVFMTHVADNTPEEQALLIQTLDYVQSLGFKVESFYDAFDKHRNPIEQGHFDMSTRKFDFAVDIFGNVDYRSQFPRPGFNTYISQYPDGTHSFRYTDTDVSNSPTGKGGTLTTVVVPNAGAGYSYQLFSPYAQSTLFIRTPIEDGTWSGWQEFQMKQALFSRPSFDLGSTYYPEGVHNFRYTNADVEGKNPPLPLGGALTTYRVSSEGYDYQIYRPYVRNRLFMRGSLANGDWDVWSEISMGAVE